MAFYLYLFILVMINLLTWKLLNSMRKVLTLPLVIAAAGTTLFQILAAIFQGYIDSLVLVAVVMQLFLSYITGLIVCLIVYKFKKPA